MQSRYQICSTNGKVDYQLFAVRFHTFHKQLLVFLGSTFLVTDINEFSTEARTVAYAENFHGGVFKVPKFFFALKSKV